jgi:hypothetical protein
VSCSLRRTHPATRRLVVFLSSVRRGLEQERDNLPPLIQAIGHECKRFEDYTAQPVPSRQACVRGVDQADVYLLVLGGRYGEPVFDSRLAPTEEELRGFEPLTPCMPLTSPPFTSQHTATRSHTSLLLSRRIRCSETWRRTAM